MIRRPPRSTRTDTSFPTRRSSDLVVTQIRQVFGKGNDFAAKITYSAKDAANSLKAFRNSPTLRVAVTRSEEHTSELQSLMRISYAVFCLKNKNINKINTKNRNSERHNRQYHQIHCTYTYKY